MFKALFGFFNRDISGRTWEAKASHPYFGETVLFAFKDTGKSYWEAEGDCEGNRLGVCINARDRREPSEKQVLFARRIVSEQDSVFRPGQASVSYRVRTMAQETFALRLNDRSASSSKDFNIEN